MLSSRGLAIATKERVRRTLNVLTHRTFSLPLVVLMPHSRCNARCLMCDIWKANHEAKDLTADDLRPLLDTFDRWNTNRFVLSGGEALMSKNLWLLCAMLKRRPVRITLLSTGLTLERAAPDVARWVDEVVVSLDGSAPVHDRIRNVPRAFERLAAGVAAVKRERASVRVTARSVVQRENHTDFANTIEAAAGIGLDAISFLPVDVSSEAFNRPDPWGDERVGETALTRTEVDALELGIERALVKHRDLIDRGFVTEDRTKLRRIPMYFRAVLGLGPFPPVRCNAPWVSTVIEADGTVRPCFFHAPLGNVRQTDLASIVDGPEAVRFRKKLDVERDRTCRRCVCSLEIRPGTEV